MYVAAGVESVSRAGPNSEGTLPETQNPKLQGHDGTPNASRCPAADRAC